MLPAQPHIPHTSQACYNCVAAVYNTDHAIFRCPRFNQQRRQLLNSLQRYIINPTLDLLHCRSESANYDIAFALTAVSRTTTERHKANMGDVGSMLVGALVEAADRGLFDKVAKPAPVLEGDYAEHTPVAKATDGDNT